MPMVAGDNEGEKHYIVIKKEVVTTRSFIYRDRAAVSDQTLLSGGLGETLYVV